MERLGKRKAESWIGEGVLKNDEWTFAKLCLSN